MSRLSFTLRTLVVTIKIHFMLKMYSEKPFNINAFINPNVK